MNSKKKGMDYYLKADKIIRDLAHGYVFLTDFELSIVDTIEFQRLKDVRQLTCQHVYPGARHTRFEHSLGVMELTRRAIDALNGNGFISGKHFDVLESKLRFNAALAALLHDVGHCPFSHLGEREFDRDNVWMRLCEDIEVKLPDSSLLQQLKPLDIREKEGKPTPVGTKLKTIRKQYPGAVHEQLSCQVILEKLYNQLSQVKNDTDDALSVDFELICRSILGLEYDTSIDIYSDNMETYELNQRKNVIVHLINSKAFDMDKLDYIMRDSCMTGIGAPIIDTNRLFKNIHLNDDYDLVFSSRAVPALQNMIDARDELYMYVYNHHAVIFSDFMYTYLFRRFSHNARDFNSILKFAYTELISKESVTTFTNIDFEEEQITKLGSVPKDYLFSPGAIIYENRSDGDLISLLNVINVSLRDNWFGCNSGNLDLLNKSFAGYIDLKLEDVVPKDKRKEIITRIENMNSEGYTGKLLESVKAYFSKIQHTYELIDRYMRRDYLKPWWKTYSEFNLFIEHNFPSDSVRRKLCEWICNGTDDDPEGDEFRSQLAKHVTYITNNSNVKSKLCQPLRQGDFFVIERSAKFFDPNTLKELEIAQKTNEITGDPGNTKYHLGDYYIKELPQIIPQKDFYTVYAKNSFYVFSKRLDYSPEITAEQERHHYQLIEQIFVFVATELVNLGKLHFQYMFGKEIPLETKRNNEMDSRDEMCALFIDKNIME